MVTVPLILLAIPSVGIGYIAFDPIMDGEYFQSTLYVALEHMAEESHHEVLEGALGMALHAFSTLPFWLAAAGVATSWFFYMKRPGIPAAIRKQFSFIYTLLDNKYYFDRFNDWFFAGGARGVSGILWRLGDIKLIDGLMVNGSAKLVGLFSGLIRHLQSGYIYHYAFSMIIGVFVLLSVRNWF